MYRVKEYDYYGARKYTVEDTEELASTFYKYGYFYNDKKPNDRSAWLRIRDSEVYDEIGKLSNELVMKIIQPYKFARKRKVDRKVVWEYNTKLYSYRKTFRFRNGPVPGVSNYGNSYGGGHRSGLRLQERRRFEEDKQYFPYLTKPDYVSVYDDLDKSCAKSNRRAWKRSKVKKQWMKNA
jgi:hypothetical protein